MNIPIKPITEKTVNRFPMLYKMQALKAIDYEVHDAIRTTADVFIMASIIAVIEEFNCGTSANATKIRKYIARLQDIIDINAEYYGDAVAIGLRNKLHGLGVNYKGVTEGEQT